MQKLVADGAYIYTADNDEQPIGLALRGNRKMADAESDAKLWAAAPDLLVALEATQDRLGMILENDAENGMPEDESIVSAWKAADAAIAKAKGK